MPLVLYCALKLCILNVNNIVSMIELFGDFFVEHQKSTALKEQIIVVFVAGLRSCLVLLAASYFSGLVPTPPS